MYQMSQALHCIDEKFQEEFSNTSSGCIEIAKKVLQAAFENFFHVNLMRGLQKYAKENVWLYFKDLEPHRARQHNFWE